MFAFSIKLRNITIKKLKSFFLSFNNSLFLLLYFFSFVQVFILSLYLAFAFIIFAFFTLLIWLLIVIIVSIKINLSFYLDCPFLINPTDKFVKLFPLCGSHLWSLIILQFITSFNNDLSCGRQFTYQQLEENNIQFTISFEEYCMEHLFQNLYSGLRLRIRDNLLQNLCEGLCQFIIYLWLILIQQYKLIYVQQRPQILTTQITLPIKHQNNNLIHSIRVTHKKLLPETGHEGSQVGTFLSIQSDQFVHSSFEGCYLGLRRLGVCGLGDCGQVFLLVWERDVV